MSIGRNNFRLWPPMHPVWLRCKNSEYPDSPAFSRLAGRAPQHPKLRTYFFVNPKDLDPLTIAIDTNFAKDGGLQSLGDKGEAVLLYSKSLLTKQMTYEKLARRVKIFEKMN